MSKNLDILFKLLHSQHEPELFDKILCRIARELDVKLFTFSSISNLYFESPFAVSAIIYDAKGRSILSLRREITPSTWTKEHALPYIQNMEVNVSSYKELFEKFVEFYIRNKNFSSSICSEFLPVNEKLIGDAYEAGHTTSFFRDSSWIDVSIMLHLSGLTPEDYLIQHGFSVPEESEGNINPLYKCRVAALCYLHMLYQKASN